MCYHNHHITFVPILMMTNLDAGVCSSSPCFSTVVLLVGFELEPEVGERKAMNEFFLIIMIIMKEWYSWLVMGKEIAEEFFLWIWSYLCFEFGF